MNQQDQAIDPSQVDTGAQQIETLANPQDAQPNYTKPDTQNIVPENGDTGDHFHIIGNEALNLSDPIRRLANINASPAADRARIEKEAAMEDTWKPDEKPLPDSDHPKSSTQIVAHAIGIPKDNWSTFAAESASKVISAEKAVGDKVIKYGQQAAAGVEDAAKATWNAVVDFSTWAEKNLQKLTGADLSSFDSSGYKIDPGTSAFPQPQTWDEALVRGVTSWVVPFAGWSKAIKTAGITGQVSNILASTTATGGISMDPHAKGFSDLINEHAPFLMNPYTAYFVANPNDTDAEGRLKNIIASLGMGAMGDGLYQGMKLMKSSTLAQNAAHDFNRIVGNEVGAVGGGKPPPPNAEMTSGADLPLSKETQLAQAQPPPYKPSGRGTVMDLISDQYDANSAEKLSQAMVNAKDEGPVAARAGNIDQTRRNIPMEQKKLVAEFQRMDQQLAEMMVRGKRTNEETLAAAHQIPMTVNDIVNHPVGRAYNAEEGTKLEIMLNDAVTNLKPLVDKVLSPEATDADRALLLQASETARIINLKLQGANAEAGRALQAKNIVTGVSDAKSRMNLLGQQIDFRGGASGVEDLAQAYKRAFDVNLPTDQYGEVTQRGLIKSSVDAVDSVVKSFMLSNPRSWGKKLAADTFMLGTKTAENVAAATVGGVRRLVGNPDPGSYITFGEVGANFLGQVNALQDVMREMKIAASGGPQMTAKMRATGDFLMGQNSVRPGSEQTLIDRGANLISGIAPGPRVLNAFTVGTQSVAERGSLWAQAVRQAETLGLKGQEFSDFVSNLKDHPTNDMILKAEADGQDTAFVKPLQGGYKAISDGVKKIPFLRALIPFHQVELNTIDAALQRSPVALLTPQFWGNMKAGGVSRDMAISKLGLGAVGMATFVQLASMGEMTGKMPENPSMREIWKLQNKPEYSLRIGEKWYQYKDLGLMGKMMAMAADYANLWSDHEEQDPGINEKLAMSMIMLAGHQATPEFIMNGVGGLVDALHNPEDESKTEKFIKGAAGIPMGGLFGGIAHSPLGDIGTKDTNPDPNQSFEGQVWDSVLNKLKSQSPWHSADLPPQMNIFGKPIILAPGHGWDAFSPIYNSEGKDSPMTKELERLGMAEKVMRPDKDPDIEHLVLTMPPRQLKMPTDMPDGSSGMILRKLTPQEYGAFVKLSAGIGLDGVDTTLEKRLDALVRGKFRDDPMVIGNPDNDNVRRNAINKIIRDYRSKANDQMLHGGSENHHDYTGDLEKMADKKIQSRERPTKRSGAIGIQ